MPLLDTVGFCGVDDTVDLKELVKLSEGRPWVEWGILVRPDLAGQPRFASPDLVRQLGELAGAIGDKDAPAPAGSVTWASANIRLACHLCGEDAFQALQGNAEHVQKMHNRIGFQRAQINPTVNNGAGAAWNKDGEAGQAGGWEPKASSECLRKLAAALPNIEFILQTNKETHELFTLLFEDPERPAPKNFAALYDPSCGMGISSTFTAAPIKGTHCGYAGGISAQNVVDKIKEVADCCKDHEETVWIDMESGIRTVDTTNKTDIFDLGKCKSVIEAVIHLRDTTMPAVIAPSACEHAVKRQRGGISPDATSVDGSAVQ